MTLNRWVAGWLALVVIYGGQGPPPPADGQGSEAAGMITEIKVGRGRVEVRPAGAQDWRRAGPLLALRAGDAVRATEDASAVIVLSGGKGSVKVVATGSPFVVPAPQSGESKAQKVLTLLDASLGFLSTTAKELPRATLSTRGGARPPVILTPRNGLVLPDSLTVEWQGSRFSRYTIRIIAPEGVALEKKDLAGARFDYPPDAPPLKPGVRYTVQVVSGNHPVQAAWFEILDPNRAQAVRQDLAELEQAVGPTVSPNTLVALRAGFLARNGLFHDARLALVAALAKDPTEPTLYLLLGSLYAKAGLPDQANESYGEASFLMSGPARQ
ncbi:MAG: hypothetical protein HY725_00370 [Candidatus Rokubacteria bacterium]|nr:hypothetical protein [Candidatus Rokubacteria bacterium]